jgi:dTMP kinase
MKNTLPKGFYLAIDGPDGCGKTTQYNLLEKRLISEGYDVVKTREPGSTKLSERIRELLLHDRGVSFSREVQMMLYQTARRDNFDQVIIPALKKGKFVLADRSFDSTTAYQGYAGGIPLKDIFLFNNYACCGRSPDLSIILDGDADFAKSRISEDIPDKLESEPLSFHNRVVEGFREIVSLNPTRCVLIPYLDGRINETHELIYSFISQRLKESQYPH